MTQNTDYTMSFKYLDADGNAHDAKISFRAGATAGDTAKAAAEALKGVFGDGYTVTASGADVTVSATELGQNKTQFISGTISIQETQSGTAYTTLPTIGTLTAGKNETMTVDVASVTAGDTTIDYLEIDGTKYQILTRGKAPESGYKALYVDQSSGKYSADSAKQIADQLKDYGINVSASGATLTFTKGSANEGGLTLQIGDTSDSWNQLKVSIDDCHTAAIGIDGLDISTQKGPPPRWIPSKMPLTMFLMSAAPWAQLRTVWTIPSTTSPSCRKTSRMLESTIRDTDVADEMMAYTKNNILIQSAQAMLAQANQVPQGVLQLLQ